MTASKNPKVRMISRRSLLVIHESPMAIDAAKFDRPSAAAIKAMRSTTSGYVASTSETKPRD
jgi:hypothetical protein